MIPSAPVMIPRSWIAWTAPLVLGAMAWGAVVLGSFQYDDFANILDDPATTNASALLDRLATGIRPLTRLTYALSAWTFDEWAGGWLLVNVLLHLAVVLGVMSLVRLRTANAMAAMLAGACFALQPAHAAVIAYVTGRSTGLATVFIVAALWMHERNVQVMSDSVCNRRIVCAALLFACACAAKEIALVFPALVLLWELTRSTPVSRAEIAKRVAPYGIMALAAGAFMLLSIPRYQALLEFSLSLRSPAESLAHNLIALPVSVSLWFRPWALAVEHAVPSGPAAHWICGLAIVIALATGLRLRSQRPLVALGLLWPLVALLPTHSIIAKTDAITEGALYLAWIGPSIAIGAGLATGLRGVVVARSTVALAIVFAGAVALCNWRASVWRDPVALWQEAVADCPASARAWTNLGIAQLAAGHSHAAHASLRAALDLEPNNTQAMFNLEVLAALSVSQRSTPNQ
jgi:protein O-mannosyl-transferase